MSGNSDGEIKLKRPELRGLQPRSSIMEMLSRMPEPVETPTAPTPVLPAEEPPAVNGEEQPLPASGDPYLAAYSRPIDGMLPTLRLIMPDGRVRGFSYVNLDSVDWGEDEPGKGPAIVARFAGMANLEVRIMGRRLLRLYDFLGNHRIAWVRAMPAGKFLPESAATLVSGIVIRQMTGWPDG